MVRLFARKKGVSKEPSVPEGVRAYAIGDIHGRADLLRRLHERIRHDAGTAPEPRRTAVYIGDYCDRGLHTREVIDEILAGPLGDIECIYLKGNHDALMQQFLEDARVGPGWFELGGLATLMSYGVRPDDRLPVPDRLARMQADLRQALPPEHARFLRSLRLQHTIGDYHFVHAGVRPGLPLDAQSEEDLLWIRDEFLESASPHGRVIVHGHSVARAPEVRKNRIGIDTGAFASGVLTALVLAGRSRSFLATGRPREGVGADGPGR